GEDVDAGVARVPGVDDDDLPAARMLDEVGGQLGDDEADAARVRLIEVFGAGQRDRAAARLADGAGIADVQMHPGHRQRVIVTRVPSPGREWMSNSLTSRLAPPRPSPSPPPVVNPSRMACSTSA